MSLILFKPPIYPRLSLGTFVGNVKLGFEENDQNRMRELAERNQDGRLTSEEREELENYVKAGHFLALLHSKARRSLRAAKLS